MEEFKIHHFSSNSRVTKASLAEAAVKRVKNAIYRYLSANSTNRYILKLDDIVIGLNRKVNTATGLAPVDVNYDNQAAILRKTLSGILQTTSASKI